MTDMNWDLISKPLEQIYKEQNIEDYFENDEKYLKDAFNTTEKLKSLFKK